MYEPMKALKEFHDAFDPEGIDREFRPVDTELVDKRLALISEEFQEVDEALLGLAAVLGTEYAELAYLHLAKELADLLYVVYGTAEELAIPIEKVFNIVHDSNMSKVWDDGLVHYNEYGKVIKPPNYIPPDLSGI